MIALEVIANRQFDGETVSLDGKSYVRCVFRNCELVVSGGPVSFEAIQSSGCRWRIRGPAALLFQALGQAGWHIEAPRGAQAVLDHSSE